MSFLFSPIKIGAVLLRNRVVLPPMCQYAATDSGLPTAYHLAHYGARALGGLGLTILEATAVTPDGRISGNDLGLWSDKHTAALTSLAQVISGNGCVPGIQLNHAGRKAWAGARQRLAPSAIGFSQDFSIPEEMTLAQIRKTATAFASAAKGAADAGFKVIELHAAHGYLIHEFLSPLSNKRTDAYGGSPANRARLLIDIVEQCNIILPDDCALIVRLSGSEYSPEGYDLAEITSLINTLYKHEVKAIHMSTGGNLPIRPDVWPGYQLSYARAAKQAAPIPVIGVGMILAPELAEFALREEYCDLIAIGRPFLHDPHWAIKAAQVLGDALPVPENMQKGLRR